MGSLPDQHHQKFILCLTAFGSKSFNFGLTSANHLATGPNQPKIVSRMVTSDLSDGCHRYSHEGQGLFLVAPPAASVSHDLLCLPRGRQTEGELH
jgi:hypothetical protein